MPRPPILPILDWRGLYKRGKTYKAWLAAMEKKERRDRIEEGRKNLPLEPPIEAFLAALPRKINVVAFAEDWCGDVIRHAAVLQRLADASRNIQVRYVARKESPGAFARFLTNGGEAIPKFVFLSNKFVECGHWGPMQEDCRELIARGKACGDIPAARKKVAALYDADPECKVVVRELLHLIDIASSPAP